MTVAPPAGVGSGAEPAGAAPAATPAPRRPGHAFLLLGLAGAALCAGALRLPAVWAGYPYPQYVDEGHVLHPVLATVRQGRWEPRENNYPALPIRVVGGAARAVSPLVPGLDWELRPTPGPGSRFYDVVDPPEVILVGRVLGWLLGLGIVIGCGLLAARLAGDAAGVTAAFAAALLPALVARGAFVLVDVYAAVFVVLACLLAASVERPAQLARVAGAGACAGLAAVSKYPAGLVGLAVVATFALAAWPVRARLRAAALAGASGIAGATAGMPALVGDPQGVWARMRWQARQYGRETPTYLEQAFERAEWDVPLEAPEIGLPFALVAAAGLATLVARREARRHALAQLLFAALLVAVHARFPFQAFRNLLPVAALACVWAGGAAGWLAARVHRPWPVAAGAAALLAALFGPADLRFARERAALVDSRREAVDWLASHAGGGRVLAQEEAAIHPRELARLPRAGAAPLAGVVAAAARAEPRWLVLADLTSRRAAFPAADQLAVVERSYQPRVAFGERRRPARAAYTRGNALRVTVWERRPGARAGATAPPGGRTPPAAPAAPR